MTDHALDSFDRDFCERFGVVPERCADHVALLASDLSDLSIVDYVRQRYGLPVVVTRSGAETVTEKIESFFGGNQPQHASQSHGHTASGSESESRVVARINEVIGRCIGRQASDIHFEPGENGLQCRARIDGVLANLRNIESSDAPEAISRIKILAGLDIAERRRPQDGRIRFDHNGRFVDIRVSIIPCDTGEKAVLRLLDKDALRLDLGSMGFTPDQLALFRERIALPNGIILVTGPTGSGKTTTLYAALNALRSPAVNISTVEDPIEYNLEGINQTQVKPEIGLTFSAMLRALLRQDPNIIMVGEIRDRETLDIAIRASMTGHLVLSTLHTNSAVSTIPRLLDMGAEPLLLASSLRMIAAQRLVRRNCRRCTDNRASEENRLAALKLDLGEDTTITSGSGCAQCDETGYSGRTAVYELLSIDDQIKQALVDRKSEANMLALARTGGFLTMTDIARDRIESGITTPIEVLKELSA